MSSDAPRHETLMALIAESRLVSANSVMYSQATAEKAGLHSTDMESLDLLLLHGPMTAGQLCELTGLTSGTMTALIDRLERAGYVRRQRGEQDRRQVIVVPIQDKIDQDLAPITEPLGNAVYAAMQQYSERDLQVILKFLKEANGIAQREISALRGTDGSASRRSK